MERIDQFILENLKNDYQKIIDDVINNGEKTYNDINDQLDEVNKGIEIYEKNQNSYKNSPNIKESNK